METETELPPEFEPVLQHLKSQPESVREIFHYAIVLMMMDDEKARVLETQEENGKTVWIVQTIAGDKFAVVRPPISEELEQVLLQQIRQIVAEDFEREE